MSSDKRSPTLPANRIPRNYVTILNAVRAADVGTHLTAQDVFERVRLVQPRIGFATVHRGLTRLHEFGLLIKVDVPGAASVVFEPTSAPHAHFRCIDCGAIHDIAFTVPSDRIAELAAAHGFQIAAEYTTFAGRCAGCAPIIDASGQ